MKEVVRCPWAATHLFPSPSGGAALGLFPPRRPPNASRLLPLSLGAWPLPPAYSIASYTLAASNAGTRRGERGGKGRDWGGRVKEGEEDRETSRSGMTSLPTCSEGAGPGLLWPPPQESQVGAGSRPGGGARWTISGSSFDSAVLYPCLDGQNQLPGPGRNGSSFVSPEAPGKGGQVAL